MIRIPRIRIRIRNTGGSNVTDGRARLKIQEPGYRCESKVTVCGIKATEMGAKIQMWQQCYRWQSKVKDVRAITTLAVSQSIYSAVQNHYQKLELVTRVTVRVKNTIDLKQIVVSVLVTRFLLSMRRRQTWQSRSTLIIVSDKVQIAPIASLVEIHRSSHKCPWNVVISKPGGNKTNMFILVYASYVIRSEYSMHQKSWPVYML